MSSILSLSSQGVVLATAMVVSSAVLFLAFSKQRTFSLSQISKDLDSQFPTQNLRSCLCSKEKTREKKKNKNKKQRTVKFAENVKDTKGNGEEYRRERKNSFLAKQLKENSIPKIDKICRNEIPEVDKLPANRIALYNGILRDRVHRIGCSY